MTQNQAALPAPIGKLLSTLPRLPGSLLFTSVLNLFFERRLPGDVRRALQGKRICIRVTDAQLEFCFAGEANRFAACASDAGYDVLFAAQLRDFIRLLRREEDPDTLFFKRRLIIEGDTELALMVKNTLDAIDLRQLISPRLLQILMPGRNA